MKNKGLIIFFITILLIISIGLIVFMVGALNNKVNFKNFSLKNSVSNELIVDQVYEDNFSKIEIDSEAGDIYIKESDNDNVKVVIYGDKNKTTVDKNDNNLVINAKAKKCVGFCFNFKKAKIEVYIPKDYSNKIKIDSNYGDIEVDDFTSSKIEINNDYGDIKIDGVYKLKVENDYGDIKVKNITGSLNIENDYGDIKIDNINITDDSSIKSDFGDIRIGDTNEVYIDAKTDLGDVKINNNYNKSDITLKIRNDCGDIKVNN